MNTFFHAATVALLAALGTAAGPAARAADPPPARPFVVIDCDRAVAPPQHVIGELAGEHNLAQVYATRQRVMAEVRRGCLREGIDAVVLVRRKQPSVSTRELRQIAAHRPRAE